MLKKKKIVVNVLLIALKVLSQTLIKSEKNYCERKKKHSRIFFCIIGNKSGYEEVKCKKHPHLSDSLKIIQTKVRITDH